MILHYAFLLFKSAAYGIAALYIAIALFCLFLAATVNWRAALLPLALLFEGVFQALGMVLVPVAALLGLTQYRFSGRYPDRYVLSWSPNWLWLFGNEEDGIDGQPIERSSNLPFRNAEWRAKTKGWSWLRRIVVWASLRNGASNMRFLRWWGVLVDPRRVRVHLNAGREWFVSYGWRSAYQYNGPKWFFWIGWNVKPYDYSPFATTLAPGDARSAGAGFKLQLHKVSA